MNEKLQYDINTEAAQISTLSSGKTDIYIYIYIYIQKKDNKLLMN